MAHFAKMNGNVVEQVIVVNNSVLDNKSFPESESIGIEFCKSIYGADTQWLQTSYNENFRKRFAAIGMKYYPDLDQFGEDPIEE